VRWKKKTLRMPSFVAATQAAACLATQGYAVPPWNEATSTWPGPHTRHDEPADFLCGWQCRTPHACCERAFGMHLADAARVQLLSQAGPRPGRASDDVARPNSNFRVLLLHRWPLSLPLDPRSAVAPAAVPSMRRKKCGRRPSGCVLHIRRAGLRSTVVCQEAWARVGRNVALAAMNIDVPVDGARRMEVVCNGSACR